MTFAPSSLVMASPLVGVTVTFLHGHVCVVDEQALVAFDLHVGEDEVANWHFRQSDDDGVPGAGGGDAFERDVVEARGVRVDGLGLVGACGGPFGVVLGDLDGLADAGHGDVFVVQIADVVATSAIAFDADARLCVFHGDVLDALSASLRMTVFDRRSAGRACARYPN